MNKPNTNPKVFYHSQVNVLLFFMMCSVGFDQTSGIPVMWILNDIVWHGFIFWVSQKIYIPQRLLYQY